MSDLLHGVGIKKKYTYNNFGGTFRSLWYLKQHFPGMVVAACRAIVCTASIVHSKLLPLLIIHFRISSTLLYQLIVSSWKIHFKFTVRQIHPLSLFRSWHAQLVVQVEDSSNLHSLYTFSITDWLRDCKCNGKQKRISRRTSTPSLWRGGMYDGEICDLLGGNKSPTK